MQIVSIQLAVSLFHGCVRMVEVVSCVRGALTCARSHGSASCAPRSWSLGWQASSRDRGAFLGQGAGCNLLYFQQYSSEKQQVGLHQNDCLCVLPGVRVSSCACVFQGARRRRNRGVDTPAISDSPHPAWLYTGDDDASRLVCGAEFNPDDRTMAGWLDPVMGEKDESDRVL